MFLNRPNCWQLYQNLQTATTFLETFSKGSQLIQKQYLTETFFHPQRNIFHQLQRNIFSFAKKHHHSNKINNHIFRICVHLHSVIDLRTYITYTQVSKLDSSFCWLPNDLSYLIILWAIKTCFFKKACSICYSCLMVNLEWSTHLPAIIFKSIWR